MNNKRFPLQQNRFADITHCGGGWEERHGENGIHGRTGSKASFGVLPPAREVQAALQRAQVSSGGQVLFRMGYNWSYLFTGICLSTAIGSGKLTSAAPSMFTQSCGSSSSNIAWYWTQSTAWNAGRSEK